MTLTDHERRAAEAGTLRYIVRPMEKQPPEGTERIIPQDEGTSYFSFLCLGKRGLRGARPVLDAGHSAVDPAIAPPHAPGDTMPTDPPLEVVGVKAMRLHDTPQFRAAEHWDADRTAAAWSACYSHRPDWRYGANPWCWLFEVKTATANKSAETERLREPRDELYEAGRQAGVAAYQAEMKQFRGKHYDRGPIKPMPTTTDKEKGDE